MADATWKKSLIPASFRGVSFLYNSVSNSIGRQTVVKEFPGQDLPRVEDLGRLTRKFTIDMFVIGDNYMAGRDDLMEAFETAGSGELNHPYLGRINVTLVGEVQMTETTSEGGMAKFTATFVQTGTAQLTQHFDVQDPAAGVLGAAERARKAVSNAFNAAFSVANAVASTVQSAVNVVQGVASGLNSIRGKIASALLVVSNAEDAVNSLSSTAASLVQTPATLATTLLSLPATIVADIQQVNNSAAYQASISFYTSEDSLPNEGNVIAGRSQVNALINAIAGFLAQDAVFPSISPIASQQLGLQTANQNALSRLSRAANILACAGAVVTLPFESYNQAQLMLTSMAGLVDDLLTDDLLEDEVYGPLADLRASLANYLSGIANSLPELQKFTPNQTMPALIIAYQLYGDAAFESDILARNAQIRDPSAVQGGQPIQVLFNG